MTRRVALGERLIVDGYGGQIIVNPSADDQDAYHQRRALLEGSARELAELATLPSQPPDGTEVSLLADVGTMAEIDLAMHMGAAGIGLFRTEMLFLNRDTFPSEDEQLAVYREVVERVTPLPVVVSTIDIGGDKFVRALSGLRGETNPYLGLRAVRFSLEHPDMFRAQLRAVVRASAYGPTAILVPMISSLDEVRRVKELFRQAIEQVRAAGQDCGENVPLGVIIEIPSAALLAHAIVREVEFVSVGTNDLIQYTLAVDRSNERVTSMYDPLSPGVLQLLRHVADAARAAGKEASLCGEMAGDPVYTELLVGLGFRKLSMCPHFIPEVKRVVRATDAGAARELADCALGGVTSAEIRRLLLRSLRRKKIGGVLFH